MKENQYHQKLSAILEKDSRYARDAYLFVADAVAYTTKQCRPKESSGDRHISGHELLDGIRTFALEQYGPLALDLMLDWGIRTTRDFGHIVFNMVESGLLGASEDDSIEDFDNNYDLRKAFLKPFVAPASPQRKKPRIP